MQTQMELEHGAILLSLNSFAELVRLVQRDTVMQYVSQVYTAQKVFDGHKEN